MSERNASGAHRTRWAVIGAGLALIAAAAFLGACRGNAENPRGTSAEEPPVNVKLCDIPALPVTFEIPEDLEPVTFGRATDEGGVQIFLVPTAERSASVSVPAANARARVRGSLSPAEPAAALPGATRSEHGVQHFLYPALTPEGDPSEWFVVIPLESTPGESVPRHSATLAFSAALADSTALRHLSQTLAYR